MDKFLVSLNLISIYKNILNDKVVSKFIVFLKELETSLDLNTIFLSYSNFIAELYKEEKNQNFFSYIKFLLHTDENIVSKKPFELNQTLINTAEYELSLISDMFQFNFGFIQDTLYNKFPSFQFLVNNLPRFTMDGYSRFYFDDILNSYKTNGYGILSCYSAFKLENDGEVTPVENFDNICFKDLKNYEYQKDVISKNTLAFLNDKPANNILLYGDRGCGKSSTVKALVNEFQSYNLKIIQISKESFIKLPSLYEKLRNFPSKFILFIDDLSFEENEVNFSLIKAILEGSVCSTPDNTLLYATTNRIHFIKETFSGREGNEVHCNDTIDEAVSLSDRFGIVLTFSSLTKNEYIDIVNKIAIDKSIEIDENLNKSALMFSMQKGIMTPRIARQFINDYISAI